MIMTKIENNPHMDRLDLFETDGGTAPIHRQFNKQTKSTPVPQKSTSQRATSLIMTPFKIVFNVLFGPKLRWHVGAAIFISFFWIWPVEALMIGTSIGMGIFHAGFWILPLWIISLIFAAIIDLSIAFRHALEED